MRHRRLVMLLGGVVLAGGLVARGRAEEDPGARQARLANVAREEARGRKPWVLTSVVDYTRTVETTGPSSHAIETTTGHGESRREFFADGDDDTQTSTDPNDAMWKTKTGLGGFHYEANETGVDRCSSIATSRRETAAGALPCDAHLEWQPDPDGGKRRMFLASAGCAGDVVGDVVLVSAKPDPDKPGCRADTQRSKSQLGARFGGECTQDNGALAKQPDGSWVASCVIATSTSTPTASGVTKVTERTSIRVTLNGKELAYEATLEPVDAAAYPRWRPTGPTPDGSDPKGKPGNALAVHVVVRDKRTHALATKPYSARYTLMSSKVPGVLGNYPAPALASDQEDLVFESADNAGATIAPDGQRLSLPSGRGGAAVTVRSRDWGAYGSVSAAVEIEGHQIAAVVAAGPTTKDALAVPLDDNGNHIADGWEDKHGGLRADRLASEDDEATPAMYNRGDGLRLYDEYRGLYLIDLQAKASKPARVELDPAVRELVIAVDGTSAERARAYAVATRFAAMQQLHVYALADATLAGAMPGDRDDRHRRRIAPLTDDAQARAQALVWIVFGDPPHAKDEAVPPGRTVSIPGVPLAAYASPNETQAVYVSPGGCKAELENEIEGVADPNPKNIRLQHRYVTAQAWLMRTSTKPKQDTLADFDRKAKAALAKRVEQLEAFTVMHELGHAIGVQHHEVKQVAACSHGCTTEAACAGCSPFTATSGHKDACSVARRGDDELPQSELEPLLAAKKYDGLAFYCYAGEAEHLGGGDANCPMRYFHFLDGEALARFLSGAWDPATIGPVGPWHMCAENAPQRRFHQEPRDWMKP